MKTFFVFAMLFCFIQCCFCQEAAKPIIPGAYRTNVYAPLLKGKRIGVFANQTSVIGTTNLIDTLLRLGINVTKIFSPEHGFRGNADAGASTANSIDAATHVPVVSLYGKKNKPTPDDLQDIDILLFDIQDVGVRFYTYISSLQYFMEAAAENRKPLMILDRPNPNGFYIYYNKANTLAKLGRKDEAKAVAQKSIELAKAQNNQDYVRLNEKLLAMLK